MARATPLHRRVYIRDKVDIPQRFPLQRLLRETCLTFGVPPTSECLLLHFWGYGVRISELTESFDPAHPLPIAVAELLALVEGVDEYFYNLETQLLDGDLLFGLEDSAAMYLEGPAEGVAEVAGKFDDVLWMR